LERPEFRLNEDRDHKSGSYAELGLSPEEVEIYGSVEKLLFF
jgi:hypothetical protein